MKPARVALEASIVPSDFHTRRKTTSILFSFLFIGLLMGSVGTAAASTYDFKYESGMLFVSGTDGSFGKKIGDPAGWIYFTLSISEDGGLAGKTIDFNESNIDVFRGQVTGGGSLSFDANQNITDYSFMFSGNHGGAFSWGGDTSGASQYFEPYEIYSTTNPIGWINTHVTAPGPLAAVPLPSAITLTLAGLLSFAWIRRRRT
jgi:uncharacterized protein (TIGR03382 family)